MSSLKQLEMIERSAHLIDVYKTVNKTIFKIDIKINRKLDNKNNNNWWLRRFRDINDTFPGELDDRMPYIPCNKKLHIACRLTAGRYMIGCGNMLDLSIIECFTIGASGQIIFD